MSLRWRCIGPRRFGCQRKTHIESRFRSSSADRTVHLRICLVAEKEHFLPCIRQQDQNLHNCLYRPQLYISWPCRPKASIANPQNVLENDPEADHREVSSECSASLQDSPSHTASMHRELGCWQWCKIDPAVMAKLERAISTTLRHVSIG